jgi:copper ion binding protein
MNVRTLRRLSLSLLLAGTFAFAGPGDDPQSLRLKVDGMHCQSCVSMIKKTVKKIPGVQSVSIELEKGSLEVTGDSLAARQSQIEEAIEKMGYEVSAAGESTVESDSLKTKSHGH